MKPSSRSFAILVPISLALLLAMIFVAATPQGRALAQEFLSLFFRTAPDVRPFGPDTGPAVITPAANIQQAEDLTSWKVFKPSWLPEGFGFTDINYLPVKGLVEQEYSYQHSIGMEAGYFYLSQRKTPFTVLWPVGESAQIESVQIGGGTGEYVVGVWGGAVDHLEWEDNPAFQTLRWQTNGYFFEMQFSIWGIERADYADNPNYLSKDQLIDIASSMK